MKILHINHYYNRGGAETVFKDTYNFSKKLDIETYICHSDKENADLKLENFENIKYFKSINYIFNIKNFIRLVKFIKLKKIDIVHLHSYSAMSPSVLLALKLLKKRIKIIQTIHDYHIVCPNNSLYNFRKDNLCEICIGRKNKIRCLIENCEKRGILFLVLKYISISISTKLRGKQLIDKIIVPSEFLKNILIKEGIGSHRILAIGNPINIEEVININKKNEIIFFGRLTKEKGVDEIIVNFKEFININNEYILKIIGDGEELNNLKRLVKKLKLDNKVIFKGYLNGKKLKEEISEAKISIMNSKWYETFGLTPLESIVQGTIPIVKNIGALKEIAEKVPVGIIYNNNEELITGLKQITNNYDSYYEKIKIAKAKINSLNNDYYKNIKKLYKCEIE